MTIDIGREIHIFLSVLLCGFFSSVIFDFFRAVRTFFKFPVIITGILDILFWMVVTALCALCLFAVSDLELRAYQVLAIALGGILYFLTISKWLLWLFEKIICILCKIIKLFFKIVLTPVQFLYKILIVPFLSLYRKRGKAVKCHKDAKGP